MAQGYLAAIYRSLPVQVGGEKRHQLLVNQSFQLGDLTGWTTTGTVTVETGGRGAGSAWVAKIVDDGTGAGLEQIVTLDETLGGPTLIYFRTWALFAPGKTGTLRVAFRNEQGNSIGTPAVVIMSADHPMPVKGWGLWSARVPAPSGTKSLVFTASTESVQTWYLADCGLMIIVQILGATGTLESAIIVDTVDVTTFASAQGDGGWRKFYPTLHRGEQITVRTFWSTSDDYRLTPDEEVFVVLYHDVTSYTRDEFYVRVVGQTGRFPLEAVTERDITFQITSDVGTTSSTAE